MKARKKTGTKMKLPADLYAAAKRARTHSHSPYSHHPVGCAIRMKNGRIFTGCNVENASYGGTVCAERVAILKAVSEGNTQVKELVVVTDASPPWSPCGFCRQVLSEFGSSEMSVFAANLNGQFLNWTLADLLPEAFSSVDLTRKRRSKRS